MDMAKKVSLRKFILNLLKIRHNGCDSYYNEHDVRMAVQICREVTIPANWHTVLAKAFLEVAMRETAIHPVLTINCAEAIKALNGRQLVLDLMKKHEIKKYSCKYYRAVAADRLETLDNFTNRSD
jgi:hypothetical protein